MFGGSGNIPSFVPNAFAEHRADVFYPTSSVDKVIKTMYDDGAFLAIFIWEHEKQTIRSKQLLAVHHSKNKLEQN